MYFLMNKDVVIAKFKKNFPVQTGKYRRKKCRIGAVWRGHGIGISLEAAARRCGFIRVGTFAWKIGIQMPTIFK